MPGCMTDHRRDSQIERQGMTIVTTPVSAQIGAVGRSLRSCPASVADASGQVTVIFIAILGTVVVSEWVSAKVRHAII